LEIRAGGQVRVLGPVSPAHAETLEFVTERGEVAVADVAARFWPRPNMTAATNRLNTLAEAGLIVRRPERAGPRGNRYVYSAITGPMLGAREREGTDSVTRNDTTKGDESV
jgi:hypothetical protein